MEVDFTSCWMALKASIVEGNRSRGQAELLSTMAQIEVANQIPLEEQGFDDRPPLRMTRAATAQAADAA